MSLAPPLAAQSVATIDPCEERRRLHHEADVVVVGAGILGCAIATTFARQGRSVILLEKSLKEPDRIVGELLQPGGVAALEKLGLRDCLEEIDAVRVQGYEVIYYGQGVVVQYPESSDKKKPEGRSFHHGRFIQRLRWQAMQETNLTVVETTATELIKNGWTDQVLGVRCKTRGEKDFYFANLTIICDGYASTFRKMPSLHRHTPTSASKFYALELLDCPLPSALHGHVVLGDGAPVLLYQIGTHETRALIDVPSSTPSASVSAGGVKAHLRNRVLPSLPQCVQPSFDAALARAENPERDEVGANGGGRGLRSMPNSFLPSATNTTPGMVLLGDALNMRHPLTGGGMTVAFNDVVLLAELLAPEQVGASLADTKAVLKALKKFHWRRKRLSGVINVLAQALYALFAADDASLRALQLGCFRYFQLGGDCISGPTGLLAGLTRRPFVLVYHFFAVAVYSIYLQLTGQSQLPTAPPPRPEKDPVAVNGSLDGSAYPPEKSLKQLLFEKKEPDKRRNNERERFSFFSVPFKLLFGGQILWTACVVIFPYIFAELRP